MNDTNAAAAMCNNEKCTCKNCTCENCQCFLGNPCECSEGKNE
tara:strand:- start:305 stop:433 length:129 start_codon:yes stop_codon:yes gene_type:complete